jgi:hypothetical protein
MRWNDFKLVESKKLYEAAKAGLETQHAMHDLQAISNAVHEIPTEKVDAKMTLVSRLEKMADSVENFVNRILPNKKQPTQPPVQSPKVNNPDATVEAKANPNVQKKLYTIKDYEAADVRAENAIKRMRTAVDRINQSSMTDEEKTSIIEDLTKPLDSMVKEFDVVRSQRDSARSERDEAIKFVKEVTGILTILGNKVQGYEVASKEDLVSMSPSDRSSYKKAAVNAEAFTKTLKQALFGKILDMQEGSDVTPTEIKEFLQACADGKVINMLSVIQQDRGNIKDHVNSQYQKVFDIFVKENIFSYSPGTTSGAIGPGEMALSMMGNPAEKGKKGDLKVGDQEIEIKASKATGGRLNSKAIAKATTGWQVWRQNIGEILADAPDNRTIGVSNKNGQIEQVPINKWNGNQFNYNKKNKKSKEGSRYNWNQKGFDALNAEVLQPYSDFDKTFKLFHDTIKSLVQNIDKIDNWDKWLANSINSDGTVDYLKVNKAYTRIAYQSYHLADGITTIMLLRTDTLDYSIVQNGAELADRLGDDIIAGTGFNWNDDQQTPTPGLMATKQKS